MNIQEQYWKWKRAFHKRKEMIGRIVSAVLCICLIAVVVVVAYNIRQSDLKRAELEGVEKDKSAITALKKYDYGESGFKQVAENDKLILSADFTTGEICVTEKATGMNWYSNPQDRAEDEIVTIKSRVSAQFQVKFVNMEKGITVEFDNYGGSVTKGRMEHTLIENGVKFTFGFPTANVYIPVQYTLTEDGFQAEIVTDEIKGVGGNAFMVDTIALLPYFGAGGLKDEGYLFVPDGSGALIQFNNNKQRNQVYNAAVYGNNPTTAVQTQETVRESVALPVFGAKVNDHAFFSIITSGDACSTITATTSRRDSSYNHIYANAVLTDYTLNQMVGGSGANMDSHSIDYRSDMTEGKNYCVRYFFLDGEDANYVGMSNLYRDYLKKNNLLKDSQLADEKYMVLDVVGAVSIKKYVMGIKRPVVTALTTYDEVCQIVKELKEQGVENLIINYIGAMNGGLNNKLYDEVSMESVLGSKRDFRNMVNYLEEEGVLLFLESNPVDLYENGNGYTENGDSVKSFYDAYAFQHLYQLDTGVTINDTRWHLLRPCLVSELTAKFTESMKDWNVKNLSLNRLGGVLYSDYSEDAQHYISRTGTMGVWGQTLKAVDEATTHLMLHDGYAYSLPYADVITDVAEGHSSFDMQDQSVPFYQMTFQDHILLTGDGINTTGDYETAFLKALETGCSLKFNLIYGNVSTLVGTDYNTMVSYSYDYWKNVAAEQYLALQEAAGQLAGKEIVGHEFLSDNVVLTRYESAEVIVNYGAEAYTYEGQEVAAKDYLILSGGAK